ncbi:MAG TPA: DHA2 family efflux MFS transporter permease subunit [Patescibacteria group bacterium]|nr:DHA2 family efflux MFS transporter permease subunit [Patescibacteria group bacterium]
MSAHAATTTDEEWVEVPHRGFITLSVMLATIMQALDTTIANVALPHMQGELSATQDQISWVLTSYIIAAAVMTAPSGVLAAKIGRRKLFLIAVIGFTVTSVLCGIATNLPEMVVFRLFQGVFGASLVPLSQAVLLDINPPKRHASAMAVWGVGVMLGPILGPTLGGWITENFHWRWVFFINLPIGVLATFGIAAFMKETVIDKLRRFDFFGFAMLSLFLCSMQLALDRGESKDWFSSPEIIGESVLAGTALYLFLVHILTSERPFIDPAMFRDRNYTFSLMFMFVMGIILLATMALLPPFLENLMGYPVVTTGLILAPRGVGTAVSMMIAGKVVGKFDVRFLLAFGLSCMAFSLWQMSQFNLDVSQAMLVETGLLQGFGMGFVFVPLTAVAYATLPKHYRNDAAGVFSLVRNIGSSVGISIMIAVLARNIQINHMELGERVNLFNLPKAMLQVLPGMPVNAYSPMAMAVLDSEVNRQAAAISYLNDFKALMFVVLSVMVILPFLKVVKRANAKPVSAGEILE